jgi:hypothetical protein
VACGLAVTIPCSYLLMYISFSLSCTYGRLVNHRVPKGWPTGHEGFPLLLCNIFLLIVWFGSGGYLVGALFSRTVCVCAALSVFPAVFQRCMYASDSPQERLLVPVSYTSDFRRPPRIAKRADLAAPGGAAGPDCHDIDDLRVEQQSPVDCQLGTTVARVLPGRESMAIRLQTSKWFLGHAAVRLAD